MINPSGLSNNMSHFTCTSEQMIFASDVAVLWMDLVQTL